MAKYYVCKIAYEKQITDPTSRVVYMLHNPQRETGASFYGNKTQFN